MTTHSKTPLSDFEWSLDVSLPIDGDEGVFLNLYNSYKGTILYQKFFFCIKTPFFNILNQTEMVFPSYGKYTDSYCHVRRHVLVVGPSRKKV